MKYEDLTIIPSIIAAGVCQRPYKGCELSGWQRQATIEKVEAARQKMTDAQIREFCEYCDDRCKQAFANEAPWFMKIAKARGNKGRDKLANTWFPHWLVSWILEGNK